MAGLINNVLEHCLLPLATGGSKTVNMAECSHLVDFIGDVAKHDLVGENQWTCFMLWT